MNNASTTSRQPRTDQIASAMDEEAYWDLISRCLGTHPTQMQAEDSCAERINEALNDSIEPEYQDLQMSHASSTWSVSLIDFQDAVTDEKDRLLKETLYRKLQDAQALTAREALKGVEHPREDVSDWVNIEGRSSNVSEDCLVSSLSSPAIEFEDRRVGLQAPLDPDDVNKRLGQRASQPEIDNVELGWPFNQEAFERAVKNRMAAWKYPHNQSVNSHNSSASANDVFSQAHNDAQADLERVLSLLAIEDGLGLPKNDSHVPLAPTPPPVLRRATVPMITIPSRPSFVRAQTIGWTCKDARELASPTGRPLIHYSTRTPAIGDHTIQSGYFTSTLKKTSQGPVPPSLLRRQSQSSIVDFGSLPSSTLLCNERMVIPFGLVMSPTGSIGSSRSDWETTDESSVPSPRMCSRPGTPRPQCGAGLIDFTAGHDKAFNPYFMDAEM